MSCTKHVTEVCGGCFETPLQSCSKRPNSDSCEGQNSNSNSCLDSCCLIRYFTKFTITCFLLSLLQQSLQSVHWFKFKGRLCPIFEYIVVVSCISALVRINITQQYKNCKRTQKREEATKRLTMQHARKNEN